MRFVGGPMDGMERDTNVGIVQIDGYPDHEYVRTRDYSKPHDPDWFIHGLPEPEPIERFFEWHERGWEDPTTKWLGKVLREALSD